MKKLNAVMGFPLGHSLSPVLHNAIYQAKGIDAQMEAIAEPDIKKAVALIRSKPFLLTAVTIPHKQTAMPYLDEIDLVAKEIGAVNTVINRDGQLYGYNTDVIGIKKALAGVTLKNKTVLVVGAGGAAQAAGYYLMTQSARIFCLNRNSKRAQDFVKRFGGAVITPEQAREQPIDVIINTTPIGMFPKIDQSPLPDGILRASQVVFDIVYNPLETKLLRDAKAAGGKTLSGLTMFVAQGLAQEELWLGRKVENKNYEKLLEKHLLI